MKRGIILKKAYSRGREDRTDRRLTWNSTRDLNDMGYWKKWRGNLPGNKMDGKKTRIKSFFYFFRRMIVINKMRLHDPKRK